MNNPIGICLKGGIGNQLFQVFTLISKAIETNRDFYILFDKSDKRQLSEFIFFNIKDKIQSGVFNLNFNEPNYYNQMTFRKYQEIPDDCDFISGHFEHPNYFNHNKTKIIQLLKLNELQNKYKFPFKKIIAIHFRFEDNIKQNFVQKPSYYIKVLNLLKEELKEDFYNHKFIIFRTNGEYDEKLSNIYIDIINSQLDISLIKFTDLYPNITSEEEFLYMSNCNYFITTISTFCWFAFYLSNYNHKRLFTVLDEDFMRINGITILNNDNYTKDEVMNLINPN